MKFLIVLCAALACAAAKPQFLAPWALPHAYSYSAASPLGHPLAYSAAPLSYAPLAYSAIPRVSYAAAPRVSYSTSHIAYSAPRVAYSAPAVQYSAPAVQYAAPVVAPVARVAAALPVAPVAGTAKSQYHAQDELGQASYGHSEPSQTHNAVQDAFGNKVGSFSYTSPDGRILRTDYVADSQGYRVTNNAVPVGHAAPVHHLRKRSVALFHTPAAVAYSAPIAYASHHAVAAPVVTDHTTYSTYAAAPAITHHAIAAPITYAAAPAVAHHAIAAPITYAAAPAIAHHTIAAPVAYSAAVPAVSTGHVLRDAVQTTVVNNPGHAVSYRVD